MASRWTGGQIERPATCFGAPVVVASDEGAAAGAVDSRAEPRRAARHKSAAPAVLSSAISPDKRFRPEEGTRSVKRAGGLWVRAGRRCWRAVPAGILVVVVALVTLAVAVVAALGVDVL